MKDCRSVLEFIEIGRLVYYKRTSSRSGGDMADIMGI